MNDIIRDFTGILENKKQKRMLTIAKDKIGETVHNYLRTNFLFGQDITIEKERSLLSGGVIDSTGILELIGFLESTYSVKFDDNELVAENFDSIARIETFITNKLGQLPES